MPTSAANVREFLAQHRIAIAGLSRDPKDFSRVLFREMRNRGYDMVAVNPGASELGEYRCFAKVQDIDPPAEAVLVMTGPAASEGVVRDCVAAGVRRVWLFRAAGQGAVTEAAVDLCRKESLSVVEGYCPFMFLPRPGLIHRLHRFLMKLGGKLPN